MKTILPARRKERPLILGIESSCDETAAAVIRGRTLLSDEIASSADVQALYGGVVPEIASRAHTDAVGQVVRRALETAGVEKEELDAGFPLPKGFRMRSGSRSSVLTISAGISPRPISRTNRCSRRL